jgi:hypothetical protein
MTGLFMEIFPDFQEFFWHVRVPVIPEVNKREQLMVCRDLL